MTIAAGSRVQLAFIPEATYGVTPATPQTQVIDFVNFTGALNPQTISDPTIKANRQKSYARRGNVSTEGSLEVVLRPDNYDAFIEAAMQGAWVTNTLKVGATKRSFAIEQGFQEIAQYRVFNGSTISTMAINVPLNELATATFGFQGANTTAFSGTSIDATPTAVTSKPGFFHEGGVFKEGGVVVGYLSSIQFELNNNLTTNYALGVLGARDVSSGVVGITGTVTALFEDVDFYNKFVGNTDSSIEFTLTTETAESMTFNFPRVKYTSGSIPVNSDGPLTVEMKFEALYDDAEGSSLTITRV